MDETINSFLLSDPENLAPMSRKEFYAEQVAAFKTLGTPTRAVEVVNVLLFNDHGELLVQKRSFNKVHNPGQLDKSIGGHIKHGDTPDYTVMVETVQELQTPSIVLTDDTDFRKTFALLNEYLEAIAIIKRVSNQTIIFDRVIDGESVKIANRTHLYIGIYNGRTRPVDREAKGVLYYTLDELSQEMKSHPSTFTHDLHALLEQFEPEIRDFVDSVFKN